MGSHYIPVGKLKIDKSFLDLACPAAGYDETPPPAEIYCPANGFFPDPTQQILNPEWYPLPDPVENEIILLYSDLQEGKVRVQVNLTGAGGQYKLQIYGQNGMMVGETAAVNSGVLADFDLSQVQGIPSSAGFSTYMVRVVVTTPNNIRQFRAYYQVLAAKFNTPFMDSLINAFNGLKNLVQVEFLSDMNLLTTLNQFAFQATNLTMCSFKQMNALSNMYRAFYQSGIKFVLFPPSLPELTTLEQAFLSCNNLVAIEYPEMDKLTTMFQVHNTSVVLQSVKLPSSLPVLQNLGQAFNGCTKLNKIIFPTIAPLLSDMNTAFNNCDLYSFTFPESMPALTNLASTFLGNANMVTVVMPISAPNINSMFNTFSSNFSLTECLLPSDAINITTLQTTFYWCRKLKTVALPISLNICTTAYRTFLDNESLISVAFPENMNAVTNMSEVCKDCDSLESAILPKYANLLSNLSNAFHNSPKLGSLIMPDALPAMTSMAGFCYASPTSAVPLTVSTCIFGNNQIDGTSLFWGRQGLQSFNWPGFKATIFHVRAGITTLGIIPITSVEIDWANSSFSGSFSDGQLMIQGGNLSATEINRIFTALPTLVGKKVNVANNIGSATCDKTIAEAKGWTVVT